MKRKTTLRDIGNRLGLSAMTVSLALRDNPRIPESTREKVRAAMRELRYEPNLVARALATGKSNLIGVIVPNSSDPYYAEVIRAIDEAASAAGAATTLESSSDAGAEDGGDAFAQLKQQHEGAPHHAAGGRFATAAAAHVAHAHGGHAGHALPRYSLAIAPVVDGRIAVVAAGAPVAPAGRAQ